eukprot:TRINITY_DN4751_c0_g1_i1.p1 TRINITY_DN4751_c0_g1~~TRINITY_DN4751_c0_g1_i1.p1  ORF type:complete len:482 (-),score=168.44 TRINITY_DN4751_c0_g1_i1:63-1436(-)
MALAPKFIEFINRAPSHFHAVEQCSLRLQSAGFSNIKETEDWQLKPGGKYFLTRNKSTIFAFCVGQKYVPGNGFNIVGAHTDSPVLKLKPVSSISSQGFLQVGVQTYGGGLWYTWFDRDLTVAGRVILKKGDSYHHSLVYIPRPILKIPSLAIHLDREVNENFRFNKESNLVPILATEIKSQLDAPQPSSEKSPHHPILLKALADELGCNVNEIKDFELNLVDVQPSAIGGLKNEFIFSGRLDNLLSSFCALEALVETSNDLQEEKSIRLVALFDNEEVGSNSAYGADSNMASQILRRIILSLPISDQKLSPTTEDVAFRKSFLISADMAHGCHPNYAEKHEARHRPQLHKGPVIKVNANQRYATTSQTSFLLKELAAKNSIPIQEFVVRNDSPCGSTIGPILAANSGLRTIDIGNAMLSMHSIRETCGTDDVDHYTNLFKAFFTQFTALDEKLIVD